MFGTLQIVEQLQYMFEKKLFIQPNSVNHDAGW